MGEISRKSLRRFLKLWLKIGSPTACLHQTLTFSRPEADYASAKGKLNKLLDNIHKRFRVASLYVAGRHARGAFHFHVVFLFFSPVSASHTKAFIRAVWGAWRALQPVSPVRVANLCLPRLEWFSDRMKPIEYFTRDVPVLQDRWFGFRNAALLRANSRAVTAAEVDRACREVYPEVSKPRFTAQAAIEKKWTKASLRSLREYVEYLEMTDWESFKGGEMDCQRKVPDWEYLEFLNSAPPSSQSKRAAVTGAGLL